MSWIPLWPLAQLQQCSDRNPLLLMHSLPYLKAHLGIFGYTSVFRDIWGHCCQQLWEAKWISILSSLDRNYQEWRSTGCASEVQVVGEVQVSTAFRMNGFLYNGKYVVCRIFIFRIESTCDVKQILWFLKLLKLLTIMLTLIINLQQGHISRYIQHHSKRNVSPSLNTWFNVRISWNSWWWELAIHNGC